MLGDIRIAPKIISLGSRRNDGLLAAVAVEESQNIFSSSSSKSTRPKSSF
jgi:hypothetical protein